MKRMVQVMEIDGKSVLQGINVGDTNQFVQEFENRGRPIDNPFAHMLDSMSNSTIMYFEHITSMYENTMIVDRATGQRIDAPNLNKTYDKGFNGVGDQIFPLSETDKLFLSRFGLGIDFTGTLDKTKQRVAL